MTGRIALSGWSKGRYGWRVLAAEILPLGAYFVLMLALVLRHEPWRDEADTWLYARDAGLDTLISRLRYIGSPGLWYVLLMPLAKSGLPCLSQSLLHLALATMAATLWYWYAPLPRITRVLFLFSYFMAYEYAVVARSYVLTVLLLFAAAALHARRLERPLVYALPIVLLAHANVHSIGIAASLTAAFSWDALRSRVRPVSLWVAAGAMCVSVLASVYLLLPPPDPNISAGAPPNPVALFSSIGSAFLPGLDVNLAAFGGALVLLAVAGSVSQRPVVLFVLATSCGWLLYIFVFRYAGSLRHHGLLLIVALYALWIAGQTRQLTQLVVSACLVVSVAHATMHWHLDYQQSFSAAHEMAAYIRDAGLTSHAIAAHKAPYAEALLPYLPGVRFWYLGIGDFGTYMRWDRAYRIGGQDLPHEEAVARFDEVPAPREWTLLLLNAPLSAAYSDRFRLVYATREAVFVHLDEAYFLYAPVN